MRKPVFDIKVSAEKSSPFSKISQNELALQLYQLGMFNPQSADQALACLDMMDFDGKEQVKARVQHVQTMFRQLQAMQSAGIEVEVFNPVHRYINRIYFNYRDHRKIAVIDGSVAYTGGINIANVGATINAILASVLAGIIWAVIPAFFKAMWNTNETLFTLMMNYVAIQLVAFFLKYFVKSGSGVLTPMPEHGLPVIFNQPYLLNIITVAVLTAVVYVYLKKTKQGYEISVVGESENTARYIGINVRKVIVRTLVVSGALCGIAGLILVGGTNHTISTTTAGGRGFTAIMVSWLAKFNPIWMIFTSFLLVFLGRGAGEIATDFGLNQSYGDILTGIILFFIIGSEFFITYKLTFRKHAVKEEKLHV